jgi:putative ABC transport system permease protein
MHHASLFTAFRQLVARATALVRSRDLDRDFEQELDSHLALLTEDYARSGMRAEEARRAARIRLGGAESLKDRHRDVRGLPWVEGVLQDLRFAFRMIAKDRWVSGAAIVALALGIGANATGFTIVNAAFLRGLPFEEEDRLFMVSWQFGPDRTADSSYAELEDWRRQSATLDLAAYREEAVNISDDRTAPQQVLATSLTANAFRVLRQQPLVGRAFAVDEDRTAEGRVVIIAHDLWNSRYGADPNVLGKALRVNGEPATIIGVMPQAVRFPENTDIWTPLIPTADDKRLDSRSFTIFGRLRDGVDRPQAQAEFNGIAQRWRADYPGETKNFAGILLETFTEAFVGGTVRTMFAIVMAAVGFVLLIACANVANLLLSRSASRAREIALRMSIGATRWRVVRQLLIESAVLAAAGGAVGVWLASFGVGFFERAMQDSQKPYWMVFTVDHVVFAYVASLCVLTAVLFGLAPALHVSKTNNHEVLKEGGRGTTGGHRIRWFSTTMVVVEVALTIVLLAGAGLMMRSFMKLYSIDLGITTDRLTAMRLLLPEEKYPDAEARRTFFARLEARLADTSGFESFAVTTGVPPLDGGERLVELESAGGAARPRFVSTVAVTPSFFGVVSRSIVRGRDFRTSDGAPGAEIVIINERMAAQFFGGEDPIGRRIRFTERQPTPNRPPEVWRTIVGVSPTIRHGSPQDAYLNSVVYVPYRQDAPRAASLLVRSTLPPDLITEVVRREVQAIDRDQPVFAAQTVEQMLSRDRWAYRVFGGLFAILAAIALVLSAVGLYAVMSYAVSQRTQEIGVRVAVGAQQRQISWLILKRGLFQLAIGLPIGLAGALALGAVLQAMLVEMTPADPLTFAGVLAVLMSVALLACLLPVRRATQVDPVVALRAD